MGRSKQDNSNKINPQNQKKKTKKRLVLSSDEEDDNLEPCGSVIEPPQQISKKRICVNPIDVFGSTPVKQNPITVIKPKKHSQVCYECVVKCIVRINYLVLYYLNCN